MSAKLVVHKFGSGVTFKSLQIAIIKREDGSKETKFSEWKEGHSLLKKKNPEKSERLVVKIVSGTVPSSIDLDSCAKRLDFAEVYYADTVERNTSKHRKQSLMCYENNEPEKPQSNSRSDRYKSNSSGYKYTAGETENEDSDERNPPGFSFDGLSPLQYSLERVKENNARIMENIHILNRTLNYTKNKEILDREAMRHSCNTCGKCFVYETGLKRHYTMRHSVNDNIPPRWQIVWTCTECFQVWPRMNLAIKHAKKCCKDNSIDCVREIKTSSLLQCEFCEKVFTSIPRLLRHSKVHTTANNYECNACDTTFSAYKGAEQHWLSCPWLKMCYSFTLPKMLLCNACDRKFKNYEQLYNHRYKVGHFLTKTQCNNSLGLLVYQCEMCSQWFTSITALQNHRSQYHTLFVSGFQNKEDNYKDYDNDYLEPGEIDC